MKLPSCLQLICATRWHFKDITGNWLYWIYFFFNFLLKYIACVLKNAHWVCNSMNFHKLNTCIISTQIKKQNITSTHPRKPILGYFFSYYSFVGLPLFWLQTAMISFTCFLPYISRTLKYILLCLASFAYMICDSFILLCVIVDHHCIVFHCVCKDITVF